MDFLALRELLRRARHLAKVDRHGVPRVGMTLDEAADTTGLNRATIHSIENVKMEPDLKPELETIERLVMGYGQSLSELFRQIETGQAATGNMDTVTGGDATPSVVSLTREQLATVVSSVLETLVENYSREVPDVQRRGKKRGRTTKLT